MANRLTSRALLAVLTVSATGFAQTAAPPPAAPCSATSQGQNQPASQAPCAPPASNSNRPSTAEQFPFPGEPSKPAATPNAPGNTKGSAATDHPFPTTPAPRLPGDDSSSSSSSSSSTSSGSDADNPSNGGSSADTGAEGTSVHRKLPKVKKVQTDDERVDEDITVAKFYMGDENFAGAYLRAKEAVKIEPDYSLAHFTLAQVAQKMKKKEEAVAEFKTYLKLDPNGEKFKDAQKALAELQ
jgi:Tetratricopeptide repeat